MLPAPETHHQDLPYTYDPVFKKCTVRNATELPPEIFELAEDIEVLDASFGQLDSLPDRLGDLKHLRVAFLSHNNFETIPPVLADCTQLVMAGFKSCRISQFETTALPRGLQGLILTDNVIPALPETLGDLTNLRKLMLTGNHLTTLPASLQACTQLELLRLSLNQLADVPEWLFELPSLAWYSDAGNPLSPRLSERLATLPVVDWQSLELGPVIGRSALNQVYAAEHGSRSVAVKLFGNGVTTDGAPIDDMIASLVAGDHPNVIGGLARVTGTPTGQEAFMMPLIPADYTVLGKPPDLRSLTRDIYASQTSFSLEFCTQVAADIAQALAHLAVQGIQHGDIYAHNILSRNDGHSYIGDFGAASVYEASSAAGKLRQQLDVRAFGYLLDDLLIRAENTADSQLAKVRDACLNPIARQRPTMTDIARQLAV